MTDENLSNQPLSDLASESTSSTSPVQGTTSAPPTPPQTQPPASTVPPSSDPLDTTNELLTKQRLPLFLFCIFVAFAIAALFFYMTRSKSNNPAPQDTPTTIEETTPATDSSTLEQEATSSADLPPLFPGVEWEEPKQGEINFHNENSETITTNGVSIISSSLDQYPSALIEYYKNELEKRGWTQINVAGDPDNDGGFYDYRKGDVYVTFGVRQLEGDGVGRALIQYNL